MRTGRWLSGLGISALWTRPVRRARQTADCIAVVTGLAAQPDARLRERPNWDGSLPCAAFLPLWAHTAQDRDLVPAGRGGHARQPRPELVTACDGGSGCERRYRRLGVPINVIGYCRAFSAD